MVFLEHLRSQAVDFVFVAQLSEWRETRRFLLFKIVGGDGGLGESTPIITGRPPYGS